MTNICNNFINSASKRKLWILYFEGKGFIFCFDKYFCLNRHCHEKEWERDEGSNELIAMKAVMKLG